MLPQPGVPEGSRMVLNGKEFWTIHNFTTERGNVLETTGGDFIFPNGESVDDRSILEALPEQHKQRALAWWEKNFGNGGGVVEEGTARPSVADLMAENEILKAQITAMQTETAPAGQEAFEPEKELKEKETKRPAGKQKSDRNPEVLKHMGIEG